MMNCSVVGLSGQSFDLDVPKESKVGDLKRLVEDRWAVPRICQKLLCAGHIMSDAFRCEALPEKELQLVVSTETLHIALQSALAAEALDQLQKCAKECRGDDGVWSAVEAEVWDCLQTSPVVDAGVANSAAAVLVAAALARRPKTLEEAFARLEGSCERGRLASVKMLTAIGDTKHMMYLRGRLEDLCPSVRAEAVKGIASLAPLDQGLLFAISGHLHDSNVLVRQAAVEAIGQFVSACGCSECSKDDSECENFPENLEFACMAILARLQHPQVSVRSFVAAAVARAVAGAAGELCQRCGARRCSAQEKTWAPQAAQLLGACLFDAAAPVQGVALQAIAELPGDGKLSSPDLLALKAQVLACLSHSDAGVRITASRAITKLVPFGDHEVAAALRSLAKRDTDISVRTAAKNALPFMGEDPF